MEKVIAIFGTSKADTECAKALEPVKNQKTTALNLIVRMIEYPLANILVVRKVYSTLKDSCYTELCWAIHRLKMDNFFECKTSPLEIMYIPTGQKIYFRGLDDPLKITSITVKTGLSLLALDRGGLRNYKWRRF